MFYLSNRDTALLFASDIARGTPEWLIQLYAEHECIYYDVIDWEKSDFSEEMDVLYPKENSEQRRRRGQYPWLN